MKFVYWTLQYYVGLHDEDVGVERIVLLDYIHRLVSQKIEALKIYDIWYIFLIPQSFETPDDG